MILNYEVKENYIFPYWITNSVKMGQDDFMKIMEVNEWTGAQFGPLGEAWGYEKVRDEMPTGGAAWNLKNAPYVHHFWRFKEQNSAMLFKLTWGGK